jgi:hypothetical protein
MIILKSTSILRGHKKDISLRLSITRGPLLTSKTLFKTKIKNKNKNQKSKILNIPDWEASPKIFFHSEHP